MIKKIQNFLKNEHTPLEKGLLILVGILTGVIIGFVIAPAKKGIRLWCDNASKNGNNNTSSIPPDKLKKTKKPANNCNCKTSYE